MPYSDQHQQISVDGDSDLHLYDIDRVAKEMLDGQVLFEPLEE